MNIGVAVVPPNNPLRLSLTHISSTHALSPINNPTTQGHSLSLSLIFPYDHRNIEDRKTNR